jgi:hypothetical protein
MRPVSERFFMWTIILLGTAAFWTYFCFRLVRWWLAIKDPIELIP